MRGAASTPATARAHSTALISALSAVLAVICALGLAVLYLPLFVSALYSFNRGIDGKQTARLTGWSLDAYADAWHDEEPETDLPATRDEDLHLTFWLRKSS